MNTIHTERLTVNIDGHVITITNPTKPVWQKKGLTKIDYLHYLIQISNYLLPFIKLRLLTVIRYPHGVSGEYFFQKNCPAYAPEFIQTAEKDGINYIVCSDLQTLLWLGNQLALELHVPFNTIHSEYPTELVFDLDPPSQREFTLAIEAALMIKEIADTLKLTTFVKTSGNKGLQVYIPLPEQTLTYAETRVFSQFIADYLINKQPRWFTTERLKNKRGKRLYVDYLQHAPGKTIIAPYSVRGNEEALVATPLYWEEVTKNLRPEHFPMDETMERLKKQGCPFQDFSLVKQTQAIIPIIDWLKEKRPH